MTLKCLSSLLAMLLVASIPTTTLATTPSRLTPEIDGYSVLWKSEGITFEYRPGCEIDESGWFPEVYCLKDSLYLRSEIKVKDHSLGLQGPRLAKIGDMTLWVDGEKLRGLGDVWYSSRLEDELAQSADKRIRLAIPKEVDLWRLPDQYQAEPEYRFFEFVLTDYGRVTSEHQQEVRAALQGVAKERERTQIFIAFVILVVVLGVLRVLVPASIRAFRSTKTAAYRKAHQARESVSRATYDYRVNREVERLRLQEEAQKRREIERQKEILNEQLQEALDREDHQKAQEILKQLADLKTKKAPGDEQGAGDPKE